MKNNHGLICAGVSL